MVLVLVRHSRDSRDRCDASASRQFILLIS